MRRNILGDDAARADDGALADGDTAQNRGTGTDGGAMSDERWFARPLGFAFWHSLIVRGARKAIVDEGNTVTDKHLVFKGNAFAQERMTLNLAIIPNAGAFLNLDKGSDAHVIADGAAVKIHEGPHANVFPQLHVAGDEAEI